ncbi:MAG: hypothetical protein ACOYI2_00595 [Bacillota bacterium]|jgi:hypothetical protein
MELIQPFIINYTGWFILICLAVFGILLLAGLWIYGLGLPLTAKEKQMHLAGDELLEKDQKMRLQLAITINAPRELVWPYLAQLGQRRAGFYSFGVLERIFTFHIYNTYNIVDEWQNKYPGEFMFYHQDGIGSEIKEVKKNEYFTSISDSRNPSKFQGAIGFIPPFALKYFAWTWNFHLLDAGQGKTRFITRCDCSFAPFKGWRKFLIVFLLGTPSFVMSRRMMEVIKACAEGRIKDKRFFSRFGTSASNNL